MIPSDEENTDPESEVWDDLLEIGLKAAIGKEGDRPGTGDGSSRRDSAPTIIDEREGAASTLPVGAIVTGATTPDGRYLIGPEIGRGGMGIVFAAHDLRLARPVAVKALKSDVRLTDERCRRFVEEAQIAAQLQHPGIVAIHDVGWQMIAGAQPYIVMKLVTGETLRSRLSARKNHGEGVDALLRTFLQVTEAVGYAHGRRVIHRDLKPSNVMLGPFGEVHVMDWGVAKILADVTASPEHRDDGTSPLEKGVRGWESLAGSVVGTPAYMAPEQARGALRDVGPASDVFALGGILAEILTGAPTFTGADTKSVHDLAVRGDTSGALERLSACGAHPELIAIAVSCLATDVSKRPQDAKAVALAVIEYLAGTERRANEARAHARKERIHALHERRARRLTSILTITAMAIVVIGVTSWLWFEAKRRERQLDLDHEMQAALDLASGLRARAGSGENANIEMLRRSIAEIERAIAIGASGDDSRAVIHRAHALRVDTEADITSALSARERSEKDRRTAQRLEETRLRRTTHDDAREECTAYAETFRDYGIDLEKLSVEEAARQVAASRLADALSLAMDWWVTSSRASKRGLDEVASHVAAINLAAQPDGLQHEVRDALYSGRLGELCRIAENQTFFTLAPALQSLVAATIAKDPARLAFAKDLHRRIQRRSPGDFWANAGYADVLRSSSKEGHAEGLGYLAACLVARPGSPLVRLAICESLSSLERREEAESMVREILADHPRHELALWMSGSIALDAGRLDEAERFLRSALDIKPQLYVAWNTLGIVLDRLGRKDEAAKAYYESLRLHQDFHLALSNLVITLTRDGRLTEAETAVRASLDRSPDEAELWTDLGLIVVKTGRLEEAAAAFSKSIELDGKELKAIYNLGQVRSMQLQHLAAIEAWRQTLLVEPRFAPAFFNIGQTLRILCRFEEALDPLERAAEHADEFPIEGNDARNAVRECRDDISKLAAVRRYLMGAESLEANDVDQLSVFCRNRNLPTYESLIAERILRDLALDRTPRRQRLVARTIACAIRAGFGRADDMPDLAGTTRAQMRELARKCFDEQIEAWREEARAPGMAGKRARMAVTACLEDQSLDVTRKGPALTSLPPEEQAAWRGLWQRLMELADDLDE